MSDQQQTPLNDQIQKLIDESQQVLQSIEATKQATNAQLAEVEDRVQSSIAEVEHILDDLEKADKAASDELDSVILEEAEDATEEV